MKTIKSMALGAVIGTVFGAGLLFHASSDDHKQELMLKVADGLQQIQMVVQAQADEHGDSASPAIEGEVAEAADNLGIVLDPTNSALMNDHELIVHFNKVISETADAIHARVDSVVASVNDAMAEIAKVANDAAGARDILSERIDDGMAKHRAHVALMQEELAALRARNTALAAEIAEVLAMHESFKVATTAELEKLHRRTDDNWDTNNAQNERLDGHDEYFAAIHSSDLGKLVLPVMN